MGTAIIIFFIFTAATAVACELAIWGPERKLAEAAERRMRGLRASRVNQRAGPLLRQQSLSSIGFLDVILTKLRIFHELQKTIDQGALKHRAGSVLALSVALTAGTIAFAELAHVFPLRSIEIVLALALGSLPLVYVYSARNRRMNRI